MATITRGKQKDEAIAALKSALEEYEQQSTGANASIYRRDGLVRIRVIDERFSGMTRARRHNQVWKFLAGRADEDAMSQISMLVLIPPSELKSSLSNMEFDDPIPSRL